MPSPLPDSGALARFRESAATALATSDRAAFDSAVHALTTTRPLTDVLNPRTLSTDSHLATLMALAADLHWVEPPQNSWSAILKRSDTPHVFRPTNARPFVPLLPPQPTTLPTAILHAENGLFKTSFRKWKWNASALAPKASTPSSPRLAPSDTSSCSSVQSGKAVVPQELELNGDFEAALLNGMPNLSEARPAAAAAAAAFRALAPFLGAEERAAVRRAFATLPPVECLGMVVRAAERASGRAREEGVWGGGWGEGEGFVGLGGVWDGGEEAGFRMR